MGSFFLAATTPALVASVAAVGGDLYPQLEEGVGFAAEGVTGTSAGPDLSDVLATRCTRCNSGSHVLRGERGGGNVSRGGRVEEAMQGPHTHTHGHTSLEVREPGGVVWSRGKELLEVREPGRVLARAHHCGVCRRCDLLRSLSLFLSLSRVLSLSPSLSMWSVSKV